MAGHELELKAGVLPATLGRLAQRLAVLAGQPPATELLVATYFDSVDRRLADAGLALRIRAEGGRRVQTLKIGRSSRSGLHDAEEHEVEVADGPPQPGLFPAPARARLEEVLAGAPLQAMVRTRVERRSWTIEEPAGVVAVALDRGSIRAGRRHDLVSEVEFELRHGSPEAIHALAARLLATEPVRLDLASKAARGNALLDGPPDPPRPRSGRPPAPTADSRAGDAFAAALGILADAVAVNLWLMLTSDTPEGPHQLRVALRRLRVLLRLYRPILSPGLDRSLGGWARDLGRLVSPLRDADVLVPQLAARMDPAAAAALARAHADVRRRQRLAVRRAEASATVIRLAGLAALGGWQAPGDRALAQAAAVTILGPALDRLWRRVRRMGDRLAALDDEGQHEFRKLLKRLRYALELVPGDEVHPEWMRALKRLQTGLGDLNDRVVMQRFALPLDAADAARLDAVRAQLLAGTQARADQALGRSVRAWRRLRALPPPRVRPAHRR